MSNYNKLQDETKHREYADKFVKIKDNQMKISTYYFPLGKPKIVKCWDICAIYYWSQNEKGQCWKVKSWGQSFSPCWWACDMKRQWFSRPIPNYNVAILLIDDNLFKGFTVTNIEDFLLTIKPLVYEEITIENKMPFI